MFFISVNRSKAGMKRLAQENLKETQNLSSCMMDFCNYNL
jgi:hypothetical protein